MTDLGDFDLAVVGGGVNGAGIARGADNASAITRDYVFDLDAPAGAAPLLRIFAARSRPTGASPSRRLSAFSRSSPP